MRVLALALAASVVAQAAGADPLVNLLSTGGAVTLLAVAVVAYTREWVVPGTRHRRELDRERARADRYETELRADHQVFVDRVLPALIRSNDLLGQRPGSVAEGGPR